jgi:hypothetical protein
LTPPGRIEKTPIKYNATIAHCFAVQATPSKFEPTFSNSMDQFNLVTEARRKQLQPKD